VKHLARTLVFAAALCALAPPAASLASRWPGRVVSYSDRTSLPRVVAAAVRNWNAASTGLRLVRARRGGQVRVLQRRSPYLHGFGFYPPDGRATVFSEGPDDPGNETLVAVVMHEIGHALGLVHIGRACAVMNPIVLYDAACARARRRLGQGGRLCGAQPADARALVRRYGGHVRRRRWFGVCRIPVPAAPPSPRGRLLSPTTPLAVPEAPEGDRKLRATLRIANTGRWTWGRPGHWSCCRRRGPLSRDDVALRPVDARGRPLPLGGCLDSSTRAIPRDDARHAVAPGAAGAFTLSLCPYLLPSTLHLCLESTSDGGIRLGPIVSVRTRRDAAPVAALSSSASAGLVAPGTEVSFRDVSTDDRGIVRRSWDFGDPSSGAANASTAASPAHRYAAAGYYEVVLTVTDSSGQTAQANAEVSVEEPAPPG